ncbi:MAG: FtsW/RodA/SpoVE family cell cycle protein [Oscillospiraceae bacterium]|nr:FtsW/RodA/SpoVE family cell cycle protein [Oscillospiraceae bacterium]
MKKFWPVVRDYIKKSDMLILSIGIICTIYGMIMISSSYLGTPSQIVIQTVAMVLGVFLFVVFSIVDVDIIADKSVLLYIFSILFISTLFFFGAEGDTGNKAWLRFGGIGVQPAEIVKIAYIIIQGRLMIMLQERDSINKPLSVLILLATFGILFGLIIVSSSDLGSALVYFFIFAVMLFAGGLSLWWFLGGFAAIGALIPIAWKFILRDDQKNRILAPYDPSVDPTGLGVRWQANQSTIAISSGGFSGQGFGQGEMTQTGMVPAQHTDFIFTVSGEEFGFIGCMIVLILLIALIVRCFHVAVKCNNALGYLVCTGIGAMFIAQVLENIGMCLGLTPVIGLTLPFFSYGGSSILTNFAAIGIVSGIKMRSRSQHIGNY